jgi:hypothetical protein
MESITFSTSSSCLVTILLRSAKSSSSWRLAARARSTLFSIVLNCTIVPPRAVRCSEVKSGFNFCTETKSRRSADYRSGTISHALALCRRFISSITAIAAAHSFIVSIRDTWDLVASAAFRAATAAVLVLASVQIVMANPRTVTRFPQLLSRKSRMFERPAYNVQLSVFADKHKWQLPLTYYSTFPLR